jgi:ribosomal protein S18 acetylase RimI-like enzyme
MQKINPHTIAHYSVRSRKEKNGVFTMFDFTLPTDLCTRTASVDDAQAIASLSAAEELAELGSSESTPGDVLELWNRKNMQLATDTHVITATSGEIMGYTGVMLTSDGILLDVHTTSREERLTGYLLQWAEKRAQALLEATPTSPRTLYTWSSTPGMTQRLEKLDYQCKSSDYKMEITLDKPPTQPEPLAGITIRRFEAGQEERAVYAVIAEAFPDIDGKPYREYEDWYIGTFEQTSSFEPAMLYVAVADGQIVGTVLCRIYPEDHAGYIWQVAVRRAWRRRGIALQLLRTAFGEYYRRGMPTIQLSVDMENQTGAHTLYAQAGMHRRSQVDRMEKAM